MAKNRFFIFYLFLVIKEFSNFLVAYFCVKFFKKMEISWIFKFKNLQSKNCLKNFWLILIERL